MIGTHAERLDPRSAADLIAGSSTLRSEETERAGVPVQERRTVHGPDLAVTEEAAERNVPEMPPEGVGVVVRDTVEKVAAAEAGKQQ